MEKRSPYRHLTPHLHLALSPRVPPWLVWKDSSMITLALEEDT